MEAREIIRGGKRSNPETALMRACLQAVAFDRECIFWRSNTGAMKVDGPGRGRARFIRFGLVKGSSDLIGMVRGRFAAVEIKRPGESETELQRMFLQSVRDHGGFACVVRSMDEMLAAVERAKAGAVE